MSLGAAIAALALTAASAATMHVSAKTPAPPPPTHNTPKASAPKTGRHSTSTAAETADHRHRDHDEVVVFGDPFWDPLWDIDTGFVLGYVPYAYPPRDWAMYGPATAGARRGLVPVELHVHPWKASVIVDDSVLGEARDYNDDTHPLFLAPGTHEVKLQYPGYESLLFELNVQKGLPRDLHYSLIKGQGMDPRSSEETPAPAGRG